MEGQIMSKVATPPMAHPAQQTKVSHDKIAQRAYEKWEKRGKSHGCHVQDWLDAERELHMETARMVGSNSPRR
jgi:Protein of unknown function (DUF2934)